MNIADRLQDDMKDAMRGGDKFRLGVIRMARAALQTAQQEAAKTRFDATRAELEQQFGSDQAALEAALAEVNIDPRAPLDPAAQESVISQEVKRRHSAAEVFRKGGREDRAARAACRSSRRGQWRRYRSDRRAGCRAAQPCRKSWWCQGSSC